MSPHDEILARAERYCQAVYQGNTAWLSELFDPLAQVYGVISGAAYFKTATDYVESVGRRESPAARGEPYRMRILALDVLGPIASVRLHSPMLGFDYYLYLTFVQRETGWKIVNKTFSHCGPVPSDSR
jgi:hypothetical protein